MGGTVTALPDPRFWAGQRVLLTGHTGFKGAWLSQWLRGLGAEVMGVSLVEPISDPCLWDLLPSPGVLDVRADIAGTQWQEAAADFDPHVVLHLAAQALVPRGYAAPAETFSANVMGTVRVLDSIRSFAAHRVTLVITTDKVYDTAQHRPYAEASFLGGDDPYSASKAAAELVVRSWPTDQVVATARAGNVIGGGDWAADRLVPDLLRAWHDDDELRLRRPGAVRPWQHVLEPLRGYLLYAEALATRSDLSRALNFGPTEDQCVQVEALVEHAARTWGRRSQHPPRWSKAAGHRIAETEVLELDSAAAARHLGWHNVLDWRESVDLALAWHCALEDGVSAEQLGEEQLADYIQRVEDSQ